MTGMAVCEATMRAIDHAFTLCAVRYHGSKVLKTLPIRSVILANLRPTMLEQMRWNPM